MTDEKIKELTEALLSLVIKIDKLHTKRAISALNRIQNLNQKTNEE